MLTLLYRSFVFDEHLWAQRYPELYLGLRRPHKRLKANSVVNEMRALRCFFAELEDREEIRRSPFRSLPREKRRSIMREVYGTPVFLRAGEFQRLKSCTVPKSYAWVKDIFLLNCYLGCRIGDLCRIGPEKIGISSEGIEFVHYLPSKTKRKQINNQELETPLLKGASRLLHSSLAAELPQLQLRKYNSLLPKLLKYAGLDRKVSVWDDGSRENVYKPLWSVATSKLARKTFVDMMCKVQINAYAAGLHSEGSGSVHHYTSLELSDRYALMRLAFGE